MQGFYLLILLQGQQVLISVKQAEFVCALWMGHFPI